jgi:hypothetical protein
VTGDGALPSSIFFILNFIRFTNYIPNYNKQKTIAEKFLYDAEKSGNAQRIFDAAFI